MTDDTLEDRIRSRAFQIWLDEGQPEGHHPEHWERAKREITEGALPDSEAPGTAKYEVIRAGIGWAISHDGKLEGDYETKEGAFESIFSAASNAIKDGLGVSITVPARAAGESAIGSKPR